MNPMGIGFTDVGISTIQGQEEYFLVITVGALMIMYSSDLRKEKQIILTTVLVLTSGHLLMTSLLQVHRLLVI